MRFTHHRLYDVLGRIGNELEVSNEVSFEIPNPDRGGRLYAGERLASGDVHRPLSVWLELAQELGCRLRVPEKLADGFIRLTFEKLSGADSPHAETEVKLAKYGATSTFSRINKLEDPSFLRAYLEALSRANLPPVLRVLSLGVNRGDELLPLDWLKPGAQVVGLDHSETALQVAKRRWPQHSFITMNINELERLEFSAFDLMLCLSVLQSPGVNAAKLLRSLVQRFVAKQGALILSLPNGRYLGGEQLYGARLKGYVRADLSLLVRDAAHYRKYLQQHGFKVYLTGKYELLLTAVRS